MEFWAKIGFYFGNYFSEILLSTLYAITLSFLGVFLIWKRSALFSLVLSKISAVSFILAIGIHGWLHSHDAFNILSQASSTDLSGELRQLDLLVFPILILLALAMIYLQNSLTKHKTSFETFLTITFVALTSMMPLLYKIFGANQQILQNAYFTEILYTPHHLFIHYLPHLAILSFVLFIYSPIIYQISFDSLHARLQGLSSLRSNIILFGLTAALLGIGGRVLGIYWSVALTLIPAFLAIQLFRSYKTVVIASISFAVFFNLNGFAMVFLFDKLPSEPVMILQMILFSAVISLIKRGLNRLSNRKS